MRIEIKQKKYGLLDDGIREILQLNHNDFNNLIKRLQRNSVILERITLAYSRNVVASSKPVLEGRVQPANNQIQYRGPQDLTIAKIFSRMEEIKTYYDEKSNEYNRIQELLSTRNLEAFKSMYSKNNVRKRKIINMVFEILSDQKEFERFLNYNDNKIFFSLDGKEIKIGEYLELMFEVFGKQNQDKELSSSNSISTDFYIPNLDDLKNRYLQLFDRINMERYTNPRYVFKSGKYDEKIIRQTDEPEWQINSKLYSTVFKGISSKMTIEEKAMYIYCKLCKELRYDEGAQYRELLEATRYLNVFFRKKLEGIEPGTKVTCFDFARVFMKCINTMHEDIEAVVISEGRLGEHFSMGFYTENVSARLEPINIAHKDPTNDMMKAQNGIRLQGIEIISDREGLIEKALEKVYPIIFRKQPVKLDEFLSVLKKTEKPKVPNDIFIRLESFIETMKKSRISGTEFVQTLELARRANYFGSVLEKAYFGKKAIIGNRDTYIRMVLLREKQSRHANNGREHMYLIDTHCYDISEVDLDIIREMIKTKELVYEPHTRRLPEL